MHMQGNNKDGSRKVNNSAQKMGRHQQYNANPIISKIVVKNTNTYTDKQGLRSNIQDTHNGNPTLIDGQDHVQIANHQCTQLNTKRSAQQTQANVQADIEEQLKHIHQLKTYSRQYNSTLDQLLHQYQSPPEHESNQDQQLQAWISHKLGNQVHSMGRQPVTHLLKQYLLNNDPMNIDQAINRCTQNINKKQLNIAQELDVQLKSRKVGYRNAENTQDSTVLGKIQKKNKKATKGVKDGQKSIPNKDIQVSANLLKFLQVHSQDIKKAETYQPNIFKLFPIEYASTHGHPQHLIKMKTLLGLQFYRDLDVYLQGSVICGDYLNELLTSTGSKSDNKSGCGYRYKAAYKAEFNQTGVNTLEQNYLRHRQLNRKYIESESLQLIKSLQNKDDQNMGIESRQWAVFQVSIKKQLIVGFYVHVHDNLQILQVNNNVDVHVELPRSTSSSTVLELLFKRTSNQNYARINVQAYTKKLHQYGQGYALTRLLQLKHVELATTLQVRERKYRVESSGRGIEGMHDLDEQIMSLYAQLFNEGTNNIQQYVQQKKTSMYESFKKVIQHYFKQGARIGKTQEQEQVDGRQEVMPMPVTIPYSLSQQQSVCYAQHIGSLHQAYVDKWMLSNGQNIGTKITGRMIYDVQNQISAVKQKQGYWLSFACAIQKGQGIQTNINGSNQNKVNANVNDGKNRQQLRLGLENMHRNGIQIIRKVKKPNQTSPSPQTSQLGQLGQNERANSKNIYSHGATNMGSIGRHSGIQMNKNSNYVNRNMKYPYLCPNSMLSTSNASTSINNPQKYGSNGVKSSNIYIGSSDINKNSQNGKRASILKQKKQELQQYINNLSNVPQNTHSYHGGNFPQNRSAYFRNNYHNINDATNQKIAYQADSHMLTPSSSTNPKFIKYSKYPIFLTPNLSINSPEPQSCTIVYKLDQVNLKELTLRYIRDKRRYLVTKVKLIVGAGLINHRHKQEHMLDQRTRGSDKLFKIMQILNCLGAHVIIQQQKPYRNMIENNQNFGNGSTTVEILAYALNQNIQKIWEQYMEFKYNRN